MKNLRVGLALSGGGARGFAHVGVLKALRENNIPIDIIAGTSAGSFAGGAFAAGLEPDEIIAVGNKIRWSDIAGFSYSRRGILSNIPLGEFVRSNFPVNRIEDLRIRFAACACDLETGQEIVFRDSGDLPTAIRASCAIPGIFVPVDLDGKQLIDGGVITPMPGKITRELGADFVIAVDLISCGSTYWGRPTNLLGTFFQSAMMLLRAASKFQHFHADVVLEPQLSHIRPDEIDKRDEMVEIGYRTTLDKIETIKTLLVAAQDNGR
ncbi:MAG: patatin-like phospholipase family protein [Pyrinomonadaceae bacterium]|jgi:NTE family protein